MVTWYWATEYMKVLAGYIFVMFIWPSVVLRRFLKGRSTTFWFAFCTTFQPVLINTVVIVLGLCHLLNIWVVRGLYYIPFLIEVIKWLRWGKKEARNIKHLLNGTYGVKLFCHNVLRGIGRRIGGFLDMLRGRLHGHWWECGLLSAVIIYGMIYFSWGIFQNYSYGAGDMYVHNAWIYNLTQGKIFSSGVYPEGMHCFVYGLYALFDIRIFSCMLFLQPVHVAVFLLSVHIFLREMFRWKYTPMFVLAAFLTLDVVQMDAIFSVARLQWTLPQEFGFHTIFLCAAFLVRYLRSIKRRSFRGKLTKGYWDENLLVFSLSIAASLIIHFYPTIMAFFLCMAIVPVHLKQIFSRKRFVPLVTAAVAGTMVAVLPMAGALATGIPFEGSINWAMSVIRGSEESQQEDTTQEESTAPQEGTEDAAEGTDTGETGQYSGISGERAGNPGISGETVPEETVSTDMASTEEVPAEQERESLTVRLENLYRRLVDFVLDKWKILYKYGYIWLYREKRGRLFVGMTILAILIWFCYRIPAGFLKLILRKKNKKPKPEYFDGYMSIVIASVIYMVMYCGSKMGLPMLVEANRLYVIIQLLVLAVAGVFPDLVFFVLHLILRDGILKVLSVGVVMGIVTLVVMTDSYHGFLFVHLTRLNGSVLTTYSITETMQPFSYTIVSPTEELYQLIQYGWHEELISFVNNCQEKEYTLPTEHNFIFIEKTPFMYAQYYLASGPEWLAQEKYLDYYGSVYSTYASQNPNYISSELMPSEDLEGTKYAFIVDSSTYAILSVRTMVESLAYKWCQEFAALYPGELQIYYEDEEFICYYFRQNPQSLYQLGILYQE